MTPQQRKQIKQKILEELESLAHEIKELQEKTKPIEPDCSLGRLTRLEMIGEQQVNEHALQEATIRHNKLEYAFRKVDEASYGLCVECEDEIPFQRLLILPEASHCIECASH
ncbi:MAG: TraR/DksA C4-type zinc finger protein [Campylobacterota bacterium]|nr:TraR/DksA C4-type zinc finger protein [Campylobacterota bacterium]